MTTVGKDFEADGAGCADKALYLLQTPVSAVCGDREINTVMIEMRALDVADMLALRAFRGKPVALAQQVVSLLCDIPAVHVPGMSWADFSMLATDALFEVERVSMAMGLPGQFFLECRADDDAPAAAQGGL